MTHFSQSDPYHLGWHLKNKVQHEFAFQCCMAWRPKLKQWRTDGCRIVPAHRTPLEAGCKQTCGGTDPAFAVSFHTSCIATVRKYMKDHESTRSWNSSLKCLKTFRVVPWVPVYAFSPRFVVLLVATESLCSSSFNHGVPNSSKLSPSMKTIKLKTESNSNFAVKHVSGDNLAVIKVITHRDFIDLPPLGWSSCSWTTRRRAAPTILGPQRSFWSWEQHPKVHRFELNTWFFFMLFQSFEFVQVGVQSLPFRPRFIQTPSLQAIDVKEEDVVTWPSNQGFIVGLKTTIWRYTRSPGGGCFITTPKHGNIHHDVPHKLFSPKTRLSRSTRSTFHSSFGANGKVAGDEKLDPNFGSPRWLKTYTRHTVWNINEISTYIFWSNIVHCLENLSWYIRHFFVRNDKDIRIGGQTVFQILADPIIFNSTRTSQAAFHLLLFETTVWQLGLRPSAGCEQSQNHLE